MKKGYFCKIKYQSERIKGWTWQVNTYNGHVLLYSPKVYKNKSFCRRVAESFAIATSMEVIEK